MKRPETTRRRGDAGTRGFLDAGIRGRGDTAMERWGDGATGSWTRIPCGLLLLLSLVASGACAVRGGRGIPPAIDAVVTGVSEDITDGRYEKIYNEAADEWRKDATLEQSNAVFSAVKNKLGRVESRAVQAASEQTNSRDLPGHSFVITYQTKFERGDGIETFTLVERDGHWLLARYVVSSTVLK